METKARYALTGFFVVFLSLGMVGFLVWFSSMDFKEGKKTYLIHFTGSVTGLRVGESVRFHGIPIGSVKKISPSHEDPQIIQVKVNIDKPALVREDSVATIEAQGLTGFTYVQIEGGSKSSPQLRVQPPAKYPLIASKPSRIEELFKAAPQIIANVSALTDRFNRIFNDQAISDLSKTMESLAILTSDLGQGPESVKGFLAEAKITLKNFNQTMEKISCEIEPVSKDFYKAFQSMQDTGESIRKTAAHLEAILAESRPGIHEFTGTGLEEFTSLVTDTKSLVVRMNHILQDIERGPAYFMNKTPQQGYRIE